MVILQYRNWGRRSIRKNNRQTSTACYKLLQIFLHSVDEALLRIRGMGELCLTIFIDGSELLTCQFTPTFG